MAPAALRATRGERGGRTGNGRGARGGARGDGARARRRGEEGGGHDAETGEGGARAPECDARDDPGRKAHTCSPRDVSRGGCADERETGAR